MNIRKMVDAAEVLSAADEVNTTCWRRTCVPDVRVVSRSEGALLLRKGCKCGGVGRGQPRAGRL